MAEPAGRPLIRAGGAVLWRRGASGVEVALIHRPRYDDWTFPKGKLKNGEHLLRAVVREVEEEAGVRPLLGRRLSPRRYLKGDRPKRVDYWAATGNGDDFVPSDEVDRVEWLAVPTAERRLSYERDVDLLQEFAAGPMRTVPFVILRHGSAGEKRDWSGDDTLRPLDERGRVAAADLAEMLAFFGRARVVSSATARCVETMLPYAARVGVDVRTDHAFTDGVPDPARAVEALRKLLADPAPTIICTHGELVPDLVDGGCEQLGARGPEETALRKGEFWVLHVADDRLASFERHASRG
jgi:8-oxo-(d)GTP phosphatase